MIEVGGRASQGGVDPADFRHVFQRYVQIDHQRPNSTRRIRCEKGATALRIQGSEGHLCKVTDLVRLCFRFYGNKMHQPLAEKTAKSHNRLSQLSTPMKRKKNLLPSA